MMKNRASPGFSFRLPVNADGTGIHGMILLFTDFGHGGPYCGQMRAVLAREAPGIPVIDLMSNLPPFNAQAAAYLLAALCQEMPKEVVVVGVVDPGVGTAERQPVVVRVRERWFVGPGNGLFSVVARRAGLAEVWRITWNPPRLSASFHGRDLFAPVAAMLARGELVPGEPEATNAIGPQDWPDDLAELVYLDDFGNAMTGIRADTLDDGFALKVRGYEFRPARTFGEVADGEGFWYSNAIGLAEIAVNRASARDAFGLRVGDAVEVVGT